MQVACGEQQVYHCAAKGEHASFNECREPTSRWSKAIETHDFIFPWFVILIEWQSGSWAAMLWRKRA